MTPIWKCSWLFQWEFKRTQEWQFTHLSIRSGVHEIDFQLFNPVPEKPEIGC
jgi:hypothetical protein